MATTKGKTMAKTTIENVTRKQIEDLRTEAQQAGDSSMSDMCCSALWAIGDLDDYSDDSNVIACVAAIRDAEAQSEEPSDPYASTRN